MKNRVLILGAGLVTKPVIIYLLDRGYQVTIASLLVSKIDPIVAGYKNATTKELDVLKDTEALSREVEANDIVISLLPAVHHIVVAKQCIIHKKNLVTSSYVSPAMQELHSKAKELGLLFLNECGLDPGIDHMSAMKTIHEVEKQGGKITSFSSYCGGLPSLRYNNNPFGYKFSWSPRGAVLAGKNSARFMKNKEIVDIPGEELFEHYEFIDIPGLGTFEGYPNRNSLGYIEKYNLQDIQTMFRGTLRYVGHCETWRNMVKLGLANDEKKYDFRTMSPANFLSLLIGQKEASDLKKAIAEYLGISPYSVFLNKIEWLGLLSRHTVELKEGTALDLLVYLLEKKLQYAEGETDLVVLQHEFIAEYPDHKEKIISTLIDEGIQGGDTAMARTVSWPAAIATKLILNRQINMTGVQIPVHPEIYEPILKELQELKISIQEKKILL